jgi:hypothetical protein
VFVVEVSDTGIGFDMNYIPPGRLGVQERIVGSLAVVEASRLQSEISAERSGR